MSLSAFAVAFHAVESVEKCTTGSVATAAVIITLSLWRMMVFFRRSMQVLAYPNYWYRESLGNTHALSRIIAALWRRARKHWLATARTLPSTS